MAEMNKPMPKQLSTVKSNIEFSFNGSKVFDIASSKINNFDELVKQSKKELNLEIAFFFANTMGRQFGYCKMINGIIQKTKLLLELNIIEISKIVDNNRLIKGYTVEFRKDFQHDVEKVFIPVADVRNCKLLKYFDIPPQAQKSNDEICDRLLKTIILNKLGVGEKEVVRIIGEKGGFNIVDDRSVVFEARENYAEYLHPIVSKSILRQSRPRRKNNIYKAETAYKQILDGIFKDFCDLKILFLIRTASYMQTFASRYGVYFNQILYIEPTEDCDNSLLAAIFDNVKYNNNSAVMLSDQKAIIDAGNLLNDTILLVLDESKADDEKARGRGISALESKALGANKEYLQIPVLISQNAKYQLNPLLYCDFSIQNGAYDISPIAFAEILELHDMYLIENIERNYKKYIEIFNENLEEISKQAPVYIPAQRRQAYFILIATLRTYDEYFGKLFEDETEHRVIDILSNYCKIEKSNDEMIITTFGNCLNEQISSSCLNFIKRTKYIIFDEGTDSIIVDDDNIYIETGVIKELAIRRMNLHSVNSLTDILKTNDCLSINDKNSKCYRFHVQNSNGEPYMLYTYGISKKLINAENRKRLDLVGYQKFLLDYSELKESSILPLGVTADGRYVGKDISYKNKSNDSIFITGQSGQGKSFCAINLLPSLAMLGSRMLVFDVSESFTRDEILRILPEDIVNALFEFIDISGGQRKLPVNPLFIGDCTNLPAKKRRIMSFIKAVCKLDKEETKIVEGIISNELKKNTDITSINGRMLSEILKRGGKVGNKVYSLISSTLDDIELIGFEYQGWGEFFEKSKRIPVILLGDEVDSKVHTVLDVLVSSAFTWQRDHNTAPLSVVIDEVKMQNFSEGSPMHTILTQGRKFNTRFIGMTQQYISNGSHAIDVMREAGVKIFFKPAKSLDRIASELGYKNPADAGFGSMGIGDFILSCDCYNKVDGVNEPIVIHCKAINFIETPLFEKFKKEYGIRS